MEPSYKRPYLDSSVYIAAIKNEDQRAVVASNILEAARRGEFEVIASTFLITEVIRDNSQPLLTPEEEQKIDRFIFHKYITWVELDTSLATEARRLSRVHGLKPADSVHLASAIQGNADVLLRWNGRFRTVGSLGNLYIGDPYYQGPQPFEGMPGV